MPVFSYLTQRKVSGTVVVEARQILFFVGFFYEKVVFVKKIYNLLPDAGHMQA